MDSYAEANAIVFSANAQLKDRNGIVKRDPKPGDKHLFAT
jgi:hypothetical protein